MAKRLRIETEEHQPGLVLWDLLDEMLHEVWLRLGLWDRIMWARTCQRFHRLAPLAERTLDSQLAHLWSLWNTSTRPLAVQSILKQYISTSIRKGVMLPYAPSSVVITTVGPFTRFVLEWRYHAWSDAVAKLTLDCDAQAPFTLERCRYHIHSGRLDESYASSTLPELFKQLPCCPGTKWFPLQHTQNLLHLCADVLQLIARDSVLDPMDQVALQRTCTTFARVLPGNLLPAFYAPLLPTLQRAQSADEYYGVRHLMKQAIQERLHHFPGVVSEVRMEDSTSLTGLSWRELVTVWTQPGHSTDCCDYRIGIDSHGLWQYRRRLCGTLTRISTCYRSLEILCEAHSLT